MISVVVVAGFSSRTSTICRRRRFSRRRHCWQRQRYHAKPTRRWKRDKLHSGRQANAERLKRPAKASHAQADIAGDSMLAFDAYADFPIGIELCLFIAGRFMSRLPGQEQISRWTKHRDLSATVRRWSAADDSFPREKMRLGLRLTSRQSQRRLCCTRKRYRQAPFFAYSGNLSCKVDLDRMQTRTIPFQPANVSARCGVVAEKRFLRSARRSDSPHNRRLQLQRHPQPAFFSRPDFGGELQFGNLPDG